MNLLHFDIRTADEGGLYISERRLKPIESLDINMIKSSKTPGKIEINEAKFKGNTYISTYNKRQLGQYRTLSHGHGVLVGHDLTWYLGASRALNVGVFKS